MRKEAPTTTTKSSKIRCPAEVAKYTIFPNSSNFVCSTAETSGALLGQSGSARVKPGSAKGPACGMAVV